MTDQANPLALDPEFDALFDAGAGFPAAMMAEQQAALTAAFAGITSAQRYAFMASSLLVAPRVHTGYQPAEVRSEVRGRMYADSLRSAPARVTRQDRDMAGVAKMYGPRPVLACEVAVAS